MAREPLRGLYEPSVERTGASKLESKKKSWLGVTLQIFFAVWLIVINALYYMQYSDLLVSRFGNWFNRWR